MTVATTLSLGVLSVAAVGMVVRLLRGPAVSDRMVALDSLLSVVVGGIGVGAAATGDGTFLDVLVLAALLGFVSTVTVARYVERRGDAEPEGEVARDEQRRIEAALADERRHRPEGRHGS